MADIVVIAASALLLSALAGLLRVWRGPRLADRLLAAQLLGSTGIAVVLLLGRVLSLPSLTDVALVMALLAALTVAAFSTRARAPSDD